MYGSRCDLEGGFPDRRIPISRPSVTLKQKDSPGSGVVFLHLYVTQVKVVDIGVFVSHAGLGLRSVNGV